MLSLGLSLTGIPVLGRRGPAYDPDALAFFARLTNQPTDARKKLYSDMIVSLKTAGVWAKLDALYILATADAQAARQNLVADAYNLTAVGSPAFTADRGYKGDGIGAYLNTGFTPSTAGGKYSLDSAHVGLWSATDIAENSIDMAARPSSGSRQQTLQARVPAGNMGGRLNQDISGTAISVPNSLGHFVVSRTNSAAADLYKDAVLLGGNGAVSTGVPTLPIYILAGNTAGVAANFSTRQLSDAHYGAGLSGADITAFRAALNTYLTAVGAA